VVRDGLRGLGRISAVGMRPKTADKRSAVLATVLGACALIAIVLSIQTVPVGSLIALPIGDQWSTTVGILFFTVLTLAASVVTADSPTGAVLVATAAPICAATALGGPIAGAVVALIGSTERRELARGFPWYGLVGNHAVPALAATAAGFGADFARASLSSSAVDRTLGFVLAVAVAGAVFTLVEDMLFGLVLAVRQRRAVAGSIREVMRIQLPEHGADLAMAIVMATTFTFVGWWLTPVLLVPILDLVLGARRHHVAWQADHDPLTGAVLRRELDRRLASMVSGPRHPAQESGVLVADIDKFKSINDSLGHEAGDRVLREVAARLITGVRPADTVGRTGGDEFVILLPGIGDDSTLLARAEALAAAVASPMEIAGREIRIGLSVGGVLVGRDVPRAEDLLSRADGAMYEAKRSGGGCRLSGASSRRI
jgi:diguanylate cyclase (GGDEF)-like protein